MHRSYCAEHPDAVSNERLEFLGDAVLGLAVTDHVYATYPALPEGELAKLRASVVNAEVLAEVAVAVGVGPALALGKGEDASGGREKPSILADAMEAVIAAVYLDGGWDAARALVLRLLGERIEEGAEGPGGSDYKTRLQEYVDARVRPAAALPGAGRGSRPLEALLRDGHDSRRGVRRRAGAVEEASRAGGGARGVVRARRCRRLCARGLRTADRALSS